MRRIESHKVAGNENNELSIVVVDESGSGGAIHVYEVGFGYYDTYQDAPDYYDIATVSFQNGPIPGNGINGVTHEVLLAIVKDRLECFQAGRFPCEENKLALEYVTQALEILKNRTKDRIKRAVEGQLKA